MELISSEFILAIAIICIGFIIIVLSIMFPSSDRIKQRIEKFIDEPRVSDSVYSLSDPIARGFSGNLFRRTMINWFKSTITLVGRSMPLQSVEETNRRLVLAGNPLNLNAQQYYGFRFLVLIEMILFSVLIYLLNPSRKI